MSSTARAQRTTALVDVSVAVLVILALTLR
jgi:hypothetical protein